MRICWLFPPALPSSSSPGCRFCQGVLWTISTFILEVEFASLLTEWQLWAVNTVFWVSADRHAAPAAVGGILGWCKQESATLFAYTWPGMKPGLGWGLLQRMSTETVAEIESPEMVYSLVYFHFRINSTKEDLPRVFNSFGSNGVSEAWHNRTTTLLCTWAVLPVQGLWVLPPCRTSLIVMSKGKAAEKRSFLSRQNRKVSIWVQNTYYFSWNYSARDILERGYLLSSE